MIELYPSTNCTFWIIYSLLKMEWSGCFFTERDK